MNLKSGAKLLFIFDMAKKEGMFFIHAFFLACLNQKSISILISSEPSGFCSLMDSPGSSFSL